MDLFTGPLRRHNQIQTLMGLDHLDGLGNHIVGLGAVDGNAPQPLHDRSEGWAEKGVLAHPVDLEMHGEGHDQGIQEIPIGGMGGGNG